MTKYRVLALFGLLVVWGQTLTAQTYCLKYAPVKKGNTVEITVSLIASSSAFKLGASNLQFKYNPACLSNPTLVSEVLTPTGFYNGVSVTNPSPPSFAKTNDGLVSLNFNFTGTTGKGLPISTEGTDVAVIRFKIENASASPNLRPYDNNSMGTVVYDDNDSSPLLLETTGNCVVYDKPILSEGSNNPMKLKVFPTLLASADKLLNIDVLTNKDGKPLDFQILNTLGQQVLGGKTTQHTQVNVAQLALGTYIVKVGEEQVKFVIQ